MQQYQKRYSNMIGHIWLIVGILTICVSMAQSLRINSDVNRLDSPFNGRHQLVKRLSSQRLRRPGPAENGPCGKGNKGDVGCPCSTNTDCSTNICHQGKCKASTCFDNIRNSHETDVDCGGGTCASCEDGKACNTGTDCNSGNCQLGTCKSLLNCDTCVNNNFLSNYDSDYNVVSVNDGNSCAQVCALNNAGLFFDATRGSTSSSLNVFNSGFAYEYSRGGNYFYYSYGDYNYIGRFSRFDNSLLSTWNYYNYTFNIYATAITYTGSCARISVTPDCGSDGLFSFPCDAGAGYCCCGFTKQ